MKVYTVNAAGREYLQEALNKDHRIFARLPFDTHSRSDVLALNAWCKDVEENMTTHGSPQVRIPAHQSVNKCSHVILLDEHLHLDCVEVES